MPVMTTYNGADRVGGDDRTYLGRPNTWGQRSSNIIIQKADLIVAVGTRLGMQQTGFNWQEFGRDATIVQVETDPQELNKGHPDVDLKIQADANDGNHPEWQRKYQQKERTDSIQNAFKQQ